MQGETRDIKELITKFKGPVGCAELRKKIYRYVCVWCVCVVCVCVCAPLILENIRGINLYL